MGIFDGQFALLAEKYDWPSPTRPVIPYLIASTPRSGSTFLAQTLWKTGAFGAPVEYFHRGEWMPKMLSRLPAETVDDYTRELIDKRTSPNGVFGFKAHKEQLDFIQDHASWETVHPRFVIRIVRQRIIAQAVSLVLAQGTGQFSTLDAAKAPSPSYNVEEIKRSLAYLQSCDHAWRQWLSQVGVPVHVVMYERLAADPGGVTASLLEALGLEPNPECVNPLPEFQKQRDPLKEEWVDRFRRDVGLGPVPKAVRDR